MKNIKAPRAMCSSVLLLSFLILFLTSLSMMSCGKAGTSDSSSGNATGAVTDVRGSITSKTGTQRDMQNWLIVLVDKSNSVCRVAEVDSSGVFTLRSVYLGRSYTIALVSPDYVMSSVLSITVPNMRAGTVRQYFKFTKTYLPQLILNGPVVSFQTNEGITVDNDVAIDTDSDGIPDGMSDLSPALTGSFLRENGFGLLASIKHDTDNDGILDEDDIDIDNDGVPNVFDPNDDADNFIDVVDPDSNGDLTNDILQKSNDLYFKEGVEYISVQIERTTLEDDSIKTQMKFATKLQDSAAPISIQVRGPLALLNAAVIEHVDDENNVTTESFMDRRLLDDGASEDGASNDRIFGRKITLESGKLPRSFQTVFFQLAFGNKSDPWFMEFPYLFPDVTMNDIEPDYNANSQLFTLTGSPFGEDVEFYWTITIRNSDNGIVYQSPPILSSVDMAHSLPSNRLEEGESYTYSASAQLIERQTGRSPFIVNSKSKSM